MDLVTTVITSLAKSVTTSAVTRAVNAAHAARAQAFVDTFARELARNHLTDEQVQSYLDSIVADPRKQELLLLAYRRIAAATSRELGPRIVAVVFAQCVGQSREPTEDETCVLELAERMSDSEFAAFKAQFGDVLRAITETGSTQRAGSSIRVAGPSHVIADLLGSESVTTDVETASELMGSAGVKLLLANALMINVDKIRTRWDGDLDFDQEPGTGWRVTRTTYFLAPCELLYRLLGAASA